LESFLDIDGSYASVNTNCVYAPAPDRSLEFLVGVLNSTLITFLYAQLFAGLKMTRGYFQFQAPQLKVLPIPPIDQTRQAAALLHRSVLDANTPHVREALRRQAGAVERQIDLLVYELYGLDADERKAVEASEAERMVQRTPRDAAESLPLEGQISI
jgi:hypothetical protein